MRNEVPLAPEMVQEGWKEQADRSWRYRNSKGEYRNSKWEYICNDWVEHNEERYYMNSSGIMVTRWQKIGGTKWYYFNDDGDMAVSKWIEENGDKYWAGVLLHSLVTFGKRWIII